MRHPYYHKRGSTTLYICCGEAYSRAAFYCVAVNVNLDRVILWRSPSTRAPLSTRKLG